MRFLPISLLLPFLLLQACAPATTRGMTERPSPVDTVHNPYFSRTDVDHVYRANIQFGEHAFGGLLVVKKLNAQEHRVVLMGDMGARLLDLQVGPHGTKKNFAIPDLDRKMLINVLGMDLEMMVDQDVAVKKEFNTPGSNVFLSRAGRGRRYLFFAEGSGKLQRMVRRGYGKERVLLEFTPGPDKLASHITIRHLTLDLTIDLERIAN